MSDMSQPDWGEKFCSKLGRFTMSGDSVVHQWGWGLPPSQSLSLPEPSCYIQMGPKPLSWPPSQGPLPASPASFPASPCAIATLAYFFSWN